MKYVAIFIDFGLAFSAALAIGIGHKFAEELPLYWQIILLAMFVLLLFGVYKKLHDRKTLSIEQAIRQEMQNIIDQLTQEMKKLKRYNHLRKTMLRVVAEFIKERYRTNFTLTLELEKLITSNNVNAETVKSVLFSADNVRREKTKEALHSVVDILKADTFKKPHDADADNKDKMGVSFYLRVMREGTEILEKAYRYFPNEVEPKTKSFMKGEGAAGKCWRDNTPIICEDGGKDSLFKEMRDGQKQEYASMICIPANADFIKEKMTEFFGVLTIHSTEREGYFERGKEQFWFDLLQPICDVVIYSSKSSNLIETIGQSFDNAPSVEPTQ